MVCFAVRLLGTDVQGAGFVSAGMLGDARLLHTETLLANGRVLVTGGKATNEFAPIASAEIFDPVSGQWTATASLLSARFEHTATLLPNGEVLVVGGEDPAHGPALRSTELYDPASGTWTFSTNLAAGRATHTATALKDGRVLVAGGWNIIGPNGGDPVMAEIYDPTNGTWTTTGALSGSRYGHAAIRLTDGRVMVVGGNSLNGGISIATAEIYDPATGTWSSTGAMHYGRFHPAATLLADGKVFVTGGECWDDLVSAEIYDPVTGAWTLTSPIPGRARFDPVAVALTNGLVLVAGGESWAGGVGQCFDPSTGTWGASIQSTGPRSAATAALLADGRVLMVGGNTGGGPVTMLNTGEIFDFSLPATTTIPVVLTGAVRDESGAIGFDFTNAPGTHFEVLFSPNLTAPPAEWQILGQPAEVEPGHFHFTDAVFSTGTTGYYRVRQN